MSVLKNNIILASKSSSRNAMLKGAGIVFDALASNIDESELRKSPDLKDRSPSEIALALAYAKAKAVSEKAPNRVVIGSDQILECAGVFFSKPKDREDARRQLLFLRGKTHSLTSTGVVVRDGERLWSGVQEASLTMRFFSETFLDDYLDRAGVGVLSSVGAYQIEGLGIQLFSDVSGDYFAILGLPLLPLLSFLRRFPESGVLE